MIWNDREHLQEPHISALRNEGTAMLPSEIAVGLESVRVLLQNFEWDRATVEDPAKTARTIAALVHTLMEHNRSPRASKKPPRGIGYSYEEAQIVASLPWFSNMKAAIRAHCPAYGEDEVHNLAQRIRGRRREIEAIGTPSAHETSDTWLGPLPKNQDLIR